MRTFGGMITLCVLAACSAEPLFLEETDSVITVSRDGTQYADFKTYVMPDEVVDLCLQPESGTPTVDELGAGGAPSLDPENCIELNHQADQQVLDAFRKNMAALGYELLPIEERESADVALLVGQISRGTWNLGRAYCYPESYFDGCVEPIADDSIVLPVASILGQLIDLGQSNESQLKTTWTVAVHQNQEIFEKGGSSLGGASSTTPGLILAGAVDDAFAQSSYLGGTAQ